MLGWSVLFFCPAQCGHSKFLQFDDISNRYPIVFIVQEFCCVIDYDNSS